MASSNPHTCATFVFLVFLLLLCVILLEIKSVTDDGAYGTVSSNAYIGGLGRAKLESVMPPVTSTCGEQPWPVQSWPGAGSLQVANIWRMLDRGPQGLKDPGVASVPKTFVSGAVLPLLHLDL